MYKGESTLNRYQKVSTVLALCLYFPLAWQLLTGQVTQNFATWLLWGILDGIAALSLYKQKGNWYLPAGYVGGCTFTLICMLRALDFKWTTFETEVSAIVALCIIGWKYSGPRLATVLSTIGVVVGGFAQLKDAWTEPMKMPFLVYLGFVVANALATMGGKSWTVEERFYPASCTVLCIAIVVITSQRFF